MTKFDKLIERILKLDNNIRFEQIKKVLEYYGYQMSAPKGGSSHYVFRKKGKNPLTIPKHIPIKLAYVRMVKEIIETENNYE